MKRSTLPTRAGLAVSFFWLAASLPLLAQGTIRYNPGVNMIFPYGDTPWDVDDDGGAEFVYQANGGTLTVFPQLGSHILALGSLPPDLGGDVLPLAVPSEIGNYDYSPAHWAGSLEIGGFPVGYAFNFCLDAGCGGTFYGIRAYFGFNFEIDGNTHYGWALFDASAGAGGTLEEYAYNLTPGAPIFVGQVPEPSACALLTFGMMVLVFHRLRRSS